MLTYAYLASKCPMLAFYAPKPCVLPPSPLYVYGEHIRVVEPARDEHGQLRSDAMLVHLADRSEPLLVCGNAEVFARYLTAMHCYPRRCGRIMRVPSDTDAEAPEKL